MTDAPENNATGSEQDTLVSETYREIAQERTPGHLDKAVLDAAARAARPRYSLLTAWTRPAAWAATIMLSVALVLELSQSPVTQAPKMDVLTPSDANEPAFEQRSDSPAQDFEESAELMKRERVVQDTPELDVKDDDLLQRADEMARMQQGQSEQPAQPIPQPKERFAAPAASAAISSKSTLLNAAVPADDSSLCDETVTAEPESWLACIVELEEAGQTDIAREQRQLLAETFPDFKPH